GGKTGGQSLSSIRLGNTVADLFRGEHAPQEAVTKTLHRSPDPGHLNHVNSCAYNHLDAFQGTIPSPPVGELPHKLTRDNSDSCGYNVPAVFGSVVQRFCTQAHQPALPEEKRKFRYKECVQHNGTRNS